jgi:hypothetical protein
MAALFWACCRFAVPGADPLDVTNNSFVADGIRSWGGFLSVTAVNPFEGLGSLFMPVNPWVAPHRDPAESVNWYPDPFAAHLAHFPFRRHSWYWLAWLMGGTYLLGRAVGARRLTAALCAQVAAVAALPPLNVIFLEGSRSFVVNPSLTIPVALSLLTLGVFWRARPSDATSGALAAALLAVLGAATLWSDPLVAGLFMVVLAPFFAAAALEHLPGAVAAWRRDGTLRAAVRGPFALKVAAAAAAAGALAAAGPLGFLSAVARYTARVQFPAEVHGEVPGPAFALFPFGNRSQLAFALFLAVGLLAAVVLARGRRRLLAAVALAHLGLVAAAGAAYLHAWIPWRYPLPLYLELPSLPVYVVGAVCGFTALGAGASRALPPRGRALRATWRRRRGVRVALVPAVAALGVLVAIGSVPGIWRLLIAEPVTELPTIGSRPYDQEGLLALVQREVGLRPGGAFCGRLVSVVGVARDGVAQVVQSERKEPFNKWYWYDLALQLRFHAPADFSAMPWTLGIPTLAEYSHLVSPPYYYLFSRLLNRRGDYQSRNLLWPTVANVDALAALGVRYLISDTGIGHPRLVGVGVSPLPAPAARVRLYLYEVIGPNLGAYSPTAVSVVPDGPGVVRRLRAPDFDWRREVLLAEPVAAPLVPLERLELRFLPGAVRVEAASPGRSLALLPLEFSRCWEADDPAVRLVRANLAMTGLLFEGAVSTTLRFRFGLFEPGCRLRDLAELRGLRLAPDGWVPYPDFL